MNNCLVFCYIEVIYFLAGLRGCGFYFLTASRFCEGDFWYGGSEMETNGGGESSANAEGLGRRVAAVGDVLRYRLCICI